MTVFALPPGDAETEPGLTAHSRSLFLSRPHFHEPALKSGNQVVFDDLKQLRNAELVHAGAAFAGLGYQGSVQALWKPDCDHLGGLPVCGDAAAAAAPQASHDMLDLCIFRGLVKSIPLVTTGKQA